MRFHHKSEFSSGFFCHFLCVCLLERWFLMAYQCDATKIGKTSSLLIFCYAMFEEFNFCENECLKMVSTRRVFVE